MKDQRNKYKKTIKKNRRLKKTNILDNIKTLCIDRPVGGIGDVLMASVGIRALKASYPNIEITLALDRHTTYNDVYYKLLFNADFIDAFEDSRYVIREKYQKYINIRSVCIEHEYSFRPNLNRIDIFAKAMRVKAINNYIPFYKETSEEELEMSECFQQYKDKIKIFLHTASNDSQRSYNVNNNVSLVKLISSNIENVIIFISDINKTYDEWEDIPNVMNISSLGIRDIASYIKRSDLFIGPDSGLMHLAAAVYTKSLVIFGSIPPGARINHYPTHESIRLESLDCLGCWYKPCPYNLSCMRDLKSDVVFNKVKEMI